MYQLNTVVRIDNDDQSTGVIVGFYNEDNVSRGYIVKLDEGFFSGDKKHYVSELVVNIDNCSDDISPYLLHARKHHKVTWNSPDGINKIEECSQCGMRFLHHISNKYPTALSPFEDKGKSND